MMKLWSRWGCCLMLATLWNASSASAQSIKCDALPAPIIYGVGASAQSPLLKSIGQAFALASTPVTIVYAAPGGCFALDALDPARNGGQYYLPATANYTLADGVQKTCDVPANTTADFGILAGSPVLCADEISEDDAGTGAPELPASIGDFIGPVSSINLFVANKSTQKSISAEAAHFVYGFGAKSGVAPWTKEDLIILPSEQSLIRRLLGLAIGVPSSRFHGRIPGGNASDIGVVSSAADKEAAIGFASSANVDANRKVVKNLAYQDIGQHCGYYPDSTQNAFDKRNVRDGHYPLWTNIHVLTKVDDDGHPLDANVGKLISYLSSDGTAEDNTPIDMIIDNGLIPLCAMHVTRSSELGPLSSYAPKAPCGCYFDARVTGDPKSCTE